MLVLCHPWNLFPHLHWKLNTYAVQRVMLCLILSTCHLQMLHKYALMIQDSEAIIWSHPEISQQ